MQYNHITALAAFVATVGSLQAGADEQLRPFVLADNAQGDHREVIERVREDLESAGFEVVGDYEPYPETRVIAFTDERIQETAATTDKGGYAAALRAGVTETDDEVQVSYTHPEYLAHAYRLEQDLSAVADDLVDTLGKLETFGSEDGMTPDELRGYNYMFGMEKFHNDWRLDYHDDHAAAVSAVAENLEAGVAGAEEVYRVEIPGRDVVAFGVALTEGDAADERIMNEIDFKERKHTPHLPYEILVKDHEVFALHTRFRIAINFPDLGMTGDNSFWRIRSAPGDIESVLKEVAARP